VSVYNYRYKLKNLNKVSKYFKTVSLTALYDAVPLSLNEIFQEFASFVCASFQLRDVLFNVLFGPALLPFSSRSIIDECKIEGQCNKRFLKIKFIK